jgi:hypothetical protein
VTEETREKEDKRELREVISKSLSTSWGQMVSRTRQGDSNEAWHGVVWDSVGGTSAFYYCTFKMSDQGVISDCQLLFQ